MQPCQKPAHTPANFRRGSQCSRRTAPLSAGKSQDRIIDGDAIHAFPVALGIERISIEYSIPDRGTTRVDHLSNARGPTPTHSQHDDGHWLANPVQSPETCRVEVVVNAAG